MDIFEGRELPCEAHPNSHTQVAKINGKILIAIRSADTNVVINLSEENARKLQVDLRIATGV